ncbi:ornithine cyclodeaminase family protein [Bosea sp. (in: a-proteobacteria)]|jgi:alanine dehydrogenase|uniref:ornithine cyclodeaminase family protein n=1 Tax=Bosea sp. (in: a-proteobacteria) TaxID=1871050 RepID=UPI003F72C2E3
MPDTILYLGEADIAGLGLDPALARAAIRTIFQAHHQGRTLSKPKLALEIGPGHVFQSLCAASPAIGMAATKWLGMAPTGDGVPGIHAMIALNDFTSGKLLAVMDGNLVTAIRTAAMSAAAGEFLARRDSGTIGFIGCGLQARAHLAAFKSLLPGLNRVRAHGRSRRTTDLFLTHARQEGFAADAYDDPSDVVRASDVVVTSVPMQPGFEPFLDPAWLRPGAFVTAVDVARSWRPDSLRQLDIVATDDHQQQAENPPLATNLGPLGSFDADLTELAGGAKLGRQNTGQRAMFIFRGFALADLAVAASVYEAARSKGAGQTLAR